MHDLLVGAWSFLLILMPIVAIALALVVRGFLIGDTGYDVDDALPGGELNS